MANQLILVAAFFSMFGVGLSWAAPFRVEEGVLNQDNVDLGLVYAPKAQTVTIFAPTPQSDHYGNGAVMTGFKGKLYCQWQSSATDEDAADTWVAYSVATIGQNEDGSPVETWSDPMELAPTLQEGIRTSGGWRVFEDTLIAFINVWPAGMEPKGGFAFYRESVDGIHWGELKPVLMKDGSSMEGIVEQDPHEYDGRLYNAAHFQPGLLASPIFTDDLSGRSGWVKPSYTNLEHSGTSSREMEPSLFKNSDGNLVMTFRDQNSTYFRLASVSEDQGATWSLAELTNMPDSRAKQSAGNLPDGSVYLVGNPVTNKTRIPLSITLSDDGKVFDRAYNLRTESELPERIYDGLYKSVGYHYPKTTIYGDYLYISYSTNKERIEYTRIPLAEICEYMPETRQNEESEWKESLQKRVVKEHLIKSDGDGMIYDANGRSHRNKRSFYVLRSLLKRL